ncbi:hypothetical protein M2139_001866 [Enterococcus sp. PF1-24]|uniref:hypothetical protein n=1 Tax=unclassified Enterococcus TaxID=2608891 RepID=UPI00247628F6|nr:MULTISPECIES: hypothetical protein [unclassified Enterococcus]MDH6364810.1 hypothetical protein [Enterococcus sp. PFB1-1]MDH6401966.1 hypothetical protein [Enterococcus sp. PF1-24]
MADKIFVHIDTTSNTVLSRGLLMNDFANMLPQPPENLLFLDPNSPYGEHNHHTGLKFLRGTEAVENYFLQAPRRKLSQEIKWLDFADAHMLKELTPIEISELLYFGHMRTHLHSPFFYKLQNKFVYFEFKEDYARVYYRYLDAFYQLLAKKVSSLVEDKFNEKRTFFQRSRSVAEMDFTILRALRPLFQEGIYLHQAQAVLSNNEYRLPVYVVDDRFWHREETHLTEEFHVADIIYHNRMKTWRIEFNDDELFLSNNQAN